MVEVSRSTYRSASRLPSGRIPGLDFHSAVTTCGSRRGGSAVCDCRAACDSAVNHCGAFAQVRKMRATRTGSIPPPCTIRPRSASGAAQCGVHMERMAPPRRQRHRGLLDPHAWGLTAGDTACRTAAVVTSKLAAGCSVSAQMVRLHLLVLVYECVVPKFHIASDQCLTLVLRSR